MSIREVRQKGRRVRPKKPGEPAGRPDPIIKHKKPAKEYPYKSSKFTPETQQVILEAVAQGNYYTVAAALAGVHEGTIYRWIKWGRDDERPGYKEFYEAMIQAEAEAEVNLVHNIRLHAELDWRPGMELLSRRFPERWATRSKAEVTGAGGGPLEIVVVFEDELDGEYDDE